MWIKQTSFVVKALYVLLVTLSLFLNEVSSDPDADLLNAAFQNDITGLQQALAQGANVNVREPNSGQTALMGSVLRGNIEMLQYLLSLSSIDVNVPEKDGYTPAHGAGFQGRSEVMRLLWKAGINVHDDFHPGDGYAPLHRACWGQNNRHTETVRFLRDEVKVDISNLASKDGRTCQDMTRNQQTLALLAEGNQEL